MHGLFKAALRGFFVHFGTLDFVATHDSINVGFFAAFEALKHIVYQTVIDQGLDSVWNFHAALYLISGAFRTNNTGGDTENEGCDRPM
jgi:hypothetical protein